MKIISSLALCLAVALTTSCTHKLKSEYHPPVVEYPASWFNGDFTGDPAPFDWRAFNDPQLDSWLRQVMASNTNVASAILQLYRIRLEERRDNIASAPGLTGTLSMSGKQLNVIKNITASLSTSYELDLWGKIARHRDIAAWATQATEDDLRLARLTLLSEASNNYWRIGFINQRITALQQSISNAKETLRLAKVRYRAGSVSSLDVLSARQSLLGQENQLTGLQHERMQALNKQAVLLSTAPGRPMVEPASLPKGPMPQVKANIPASVLRHRPDISAQEWKLRQALATVDIKRTEYYPTLNLTSSLATYSGSLLALLQNPAASLTLPFLEWRQRGVEVKIARKEYEQRLLEFKQSLYKAMSSIEDELSRRNQLLAQETRLREKLALARQSERLNEVRYRQGAVPVSDWLDAQGVRREAESALDENRYDQFKNLAKIYVEFGGSSTFP
ncbi:MULTISPECIES: TolC family protein [Pantoea]|uniref:TolC family protein n=1 Tax=Pantoea TaxID=53335 RepID=UPI00057DA263|nr:MULTISPECIES: TolC family protein [Pantoea]